MISALHTPLGPVDDYFGSEAGQYLDNTLTALVPLLSSWIHVPPSLSPLSSPLCPFSRAFSRLFQLFFSLGFLHWKTRVALVIVEFYSNEVAREFPGGARNSPQQEAYFPKRPFSGQRGNIRGRTHGAASGAVNKGWQFSATKRVFRRIELTRSLRAVYARYPGKL